jgi:hypothetical protein
MVMARTLRMAIGVFLGLILLLFIGICAVATVVGGGAGCTLATGRAVAVNATGMSCSLQSTKDTARINAAGHKIVVAPKFLQVDGRRVATIDPNTKSIEVKATKRTITFVGDGRIITTWRR